MSMPPNSGKYAYCAASHADGRSIPAHRQRRQPETRRLPAIGWSACGGKPETVRSKGFSNGVYLRNPGYAEVTFLYICAGVSGTLTPYVSSKVVEKFSISTIFVVSSAAYGATLILMLALNSYTRREYSGNTDLKSDLDS